MGAEASQRLIDLAQEPAFALGPLEVRPATLEVLAGERREQLEPRIMQVLVALARRRGEVVSRDELIQTCWGGRIVGDDSINRCIFRLRKLAEEVGGYEIATVPRVGFRLTEMAGGAHVRGRAARWWPALAALGVLAAAALIVALAPRPAPPLRVQVLALRTVQGGPSAQAFADRLGDEITGVLNETGVQTTAPPKWVLPSLRPAPPDLVFGGTVSQDSGELRARVYLADVRSNLTLWTREFIGPVGSESSLADEAAGAASETIYTALDPQRQRGLSLKPEALALYIQGSEMLKRPSELNAASGLRALERVTQIAPDFALGHSWLAVTIGLGVNNHPASEQPALWRRAETEARRAIEIDPHGAGVAYGVLSLLQARRAPDDLWAVEQVISKGLRADPDYPFLSARMCDLLSSVGRFNEGLWYCRRGVAMRPMAPPLAWRFALDLLSAGDQANARLQIDKAFRFDPDLEAVRVSRFAIYAFGDDPAAATAILHDPVGGPHGMRPDVVAALDLFLKAKASKTPADVDRAARALSAAASARPADFNTPVAALSQLGRREAALAVLAAVPPDARLGIGSGLLGPGAASMRGDERYWTAMARMKLVQYWLASGHWPDFCADPGVKLDCKAMALAASRRVAAAAVDQPRTALSSLSAQTSPPRPAGR